MPKIKIHGGFGPNTFSDEQDIAVGVTVCMFRARSRYGDRGYDLVEGTVSKVTPSGKQFVVTAPPSPPFPEAGVRFTIDSYDRPSEHGVDRWGSRWHITTPGELARMRAEQAEADARRALAKRVNALQAALADALKPLEQRDLEPDELAAAIRAVEGLRQGLASIRRQ